MKDKTRKSIIYAALGVAIVYGIANLDLGAKSRKPPRPARSAPEAASTPSPGQARARLAADRDSIDALPWGKDPFRIATVPEASPKSKISFHLSGIVYSKDAPMAIINSRPVRLGDSIGQARVLRIDRSSVTLDYQGRQIELTVSRG